MCRGIDEVGSSVLHRKPNGWHGRNAHRSSPAMSLSRGAGQRSDRRHTTHTWVLKRVMEITDAKDVSTESKAHGKKTAGANADG